MVHEEERAIYGKIYTQGLAFDLLDLSPQKGAMRDGIPTGLRDGVAVFLVMDAEGIVKVIWVSHWSGYVIVPHALPELKTAKFLIDEGDDTESNIQISTLTVVE